MLYKVFLFIYLFNSARRIDAVKNPVLMQMLVVRDHFEQPDYH